jgi:hypothetical protein
VSFSAAPPGESSLEGFWRGHRGSHLLRLRTRVSPFESHFPRGPAGWLMALVALLLLAVIGGALAAVVVANASDAASGSELARTKQASARPVTVTEKVVTTLRQEPETVTNLVTTTLQSPPDKPPPAQNSVSIENAIALTDQSTYALRRGDWQEAERLARLAYPALVGKYSTSNPYEAYVNFDLGDALAAQGECASALRYLGRSEALQGPKHPITTAKARCGG